MHANNLSLDKSRLGTSTPASRSYKSSNFFVDIFAALVVAELFGQYWHASSIYVSKITMSCIDLRKVHP
jgi:hypothetical protein